MPDEPQVTHLPDGSEVSGERRDVVEELRAQLEARNAEWARREGEWAEQEAALAQALEERDAAMATQQELETRHRELQDTALAAHRRALLAEHAGQVVPELIQGGTIEEIEASLTTAREAHGRIADQLRAQAAASVPTGASPRSGPVADELSPLEKISTVLARNGR